MALEMTPEGNLEVGRLVELLWALVSGGRRRRDSSRRA
jgi:hypothetical protein